jgi:PHD/YefM family antitoxin component YafN of YafNO toxin-antitoxin module
MSQSDVRYMGVSEVRANMTEVIAEARLLDVDFVLTRRDTPQAVLISVKRYGSAKVEHGIVEQLRADYPEIYERLITAES